MSFSISAAVLLLSAGMSAYLVSIFMGRRILRVNHHQVQGALSHCSVLQRQLIFRVVDPKDIIRDRKFRTCNYCHAIFDTMELMLTHEVENHCDP
jgi:hypothetical protein